MVQLKGKAELAKSIEPTEGKGYYITAVEETKTAVQGFNALRVSLEPAEDKEKKALEELGRDVATMLWMREAAGVKSKLGSFLDAFTQFLGDEDLALDTDSWLKHQIRIVSWKEKAREIAVIS